MSGGGQSGQNFVSSNAGYSGTPLWKLKQQGATPRFKEEEDAAALAAAQALKEAEEAAESLRVVVDAVSLGKMSDAYNERPLVRHLIVKDLRKAAARSKVALPTGGLFENRAQLILVALFDGQSAAEAPGPLSSEWCAKQLIPKLIRNMSVIPTGYENATFIRACLKKAFEDLEKEILRTQPFISDGCGGAVALLVGERLFTAVCGRCEVLLVENGAKSGNKQAPATAIPMGSNQGHFALPEEQKFVTDNGGMVFPGEGGKLFTSNPNGSLSCVSRSIGDRAWKGSMGGMPGSLKLIRYAPQTHYTELSWADKHQCIVLTSAPVTNAVSTAETVALASDFEAKPRAACGAIAAKAAEAAQNQQAQCTTVALYFLPKDERAGKEPAAKRAKKEAESVRLRHIVMRHRDCAQAMDPVRNRPVTRSREEAEGELRGVLQQLLQEAKTVRAPQSKNAALQPSARFTALCKEISECTTAQKGGGMMGDLGWLQPDQLTRQFGTSFAEAAKHLTPGQWSDLVTSEMGIHIFQRIA